MDTRTIFHVDIDAFYANVEIGEHPSLKGKPLVVGADPHRGKGRGVVITCTYEARKYGLRSGMPISRAYSLCPEAVYLRPNFPLYAKVSARIMELLKKHADEVEQSGIDEAFMDVTSKVPSYSGAKSHALKVKSELLEKEGLTCSIGIAPNKTCAKIASDMQKPDGLTIVPEDDVRDFLGPLTVSVIPGVGPKTKTFLEEKGIVTVSDLQKIQGKQLSDWFGKGGVWLWGVVQGTERLPVLARDMPRSLSVEKTFEEDVDDFGLVYDAARELAKELIRRVRLGDLRFRTVGIRIRFQGFQTYTREKTLIDYTDGEREVEETARSLLSEFAATEKSVRLVGVRVSDLKREKVETSRLDTWAID